MSNEQNPAEICRNPRQALYRQLDRWLEWDLEKWAAQDEMMKSHGVELSKKTQRAGPALARRMARKAKQHIGAFFENNSSKSAEELEKLAQHLSPGGAHNGGTLVQLTRFNVLFADPLLMAATIRYNWGGGKAGFQFLPDPAETDHEEYIMEAENLLDVLSEGVNGDPRRVLTGEDLAFFESLPERFTVYRGCSGVSPEMAGEGLCWTVQRNVAEWFANRSARFNKGSPVVVSATMRKSEVYFVQAGESEVVCAPRRSRQIKCRPHGPTWRPTMSPNLENNAQHVQ